MLRRIANYIRPQPSTSGPTSLRPAVPILQPLASSEMVTIECSRCIEESVTMEEHDQHVSTKHGAGVETDVEEPARKKQRRNEAAYLSGAGDKVKSEDEEEVKVKIEDTEN